MTNPHPDAAARHLDFRDYLRILRRRIVPLVLATFVVTVAALVLSVRQEKVYRATVQVLLNRQDLAATATGTAQDPTLSEDPGRYAATQAAVARSAAVAKLALANVKAPGLTAGGLLAESTVTPDATADLLDVQVDDPDPVRAAQLANAYAAAFTEFKLTLDTTALANARAQINKEIAAIRAGGDVNTPQYRNLVASEQQLHAMQLLQSQDTVLSHPTAGVQVRPTPKRDTLLGLGFGLLLGVALAFALDALDRRIRSEDEIEEGLGLPVLARIPSPARPLRDRFALTMIEDPRSGHADAIRRLATNISFVNPDRPAQVLMVTSALQREGKSTTISNLAVALARAGHRVAVVDLDLRRPALASIFGIDRLLGLTEVAVGRATLDETLARVDLDDPEAPKPSSRGGSSQPGSLHVLPSGSLPAAPGEFVGSEVLATRVLDPLRERFEYILIDTPPICVVPDASILAARVDALLVVARLGVISRPALRDLGKQIAASHLQALGTVITDAQAGPAYGYDADAPTTRQAAVSSPATKAGSGEAPAQRRSKKRRRTRA